MSRVRINVNTTASTPVPSKTSQLTNDSNFPVDANYVHTDKNYTNADKAKLAGVEAGAEVNVIVGVSVNKMPLDPDGDRFVDITVPTKVSDLDNDSGFQTSAQVASAVGTETTARETADTALAAKIDKAFIKKSASGAVASFDDGGDDLPVKALAVNIEPVQSGSGDPSPTNVRPISAWTGMKVTRTGKNLLDKTVFANYSNWVYPIATSGFSANNANKGCLLPDLGAGTFTISFDWTTTFPIYLYLCKVDSTGFGTLIAYLTTEVIANRTRTFTLSNGEKAFLRMGLTENETNYNTQFAKFGNCQLEIGSTATAYEPYQRDTYSITFPSAASTVYGGTLDVTNGVLTVDLAVHEFTPDDVVSTITDLSDATISPLTRVDYFKSQNPSFPLAAAIATEPQTRGKYSHGTYVGNNGGYTSRTYHGYAAADAYHIFIPCGAAGDTVAEYLYDQQENGTPVQLCFPLAEPLTYQLTPREVRTLLGSNNIFADIGDVTVTYRADPSLVIQNIINAITSLGGNV